MTPGDLQPGDVLLYAPTGFYGWMIRRKTWHPIAHVEVFVGHGESVASRNGVGTGRYPLRLEDLSLVCRPKAGTFDLTAALAWFATAPHQPYGWMDLLQFIGCNVNGKGIVCSPFATLFLRAGGLDPFNGEQAELIAPFQFSDNPCFQVFSYAVTYVPQGV